MIIKSLTLQNIRSYTEHEPIKFHSGTLLFEGDVGCGKSTLLSAIEFALFGLGDVDGRHLLRATENEGWVLLEFEVNGKEYKVFRSLARRRKNVVQGEGYIIEDGVRTDYSVTEMKLRILEILDFNERPQPRTSSLIFRYAIFTPQEMMKEVLLQPVDRRLETLRRAFGIEDYSIARSNAEIFRAELKERVTFIKGQTEDLEEKRSSMGTEKQKLQDLGQELEKADKDFRKIDQELNKLRQKLKAFGKRKEKVIALQTEIAHLKEDIATKRENLQTLKTDIDRTNREKEEAEKAEAALQELRPQYEEYRKIRRDVARFEKTAKHHQSLSSLKTKLSALIAKAGQSLQKDIKKAQKEKTKLEKEIERVEPELAQISELRKQLKTLKSRLKILPSLSKQLTELRRQRSSAETRIEELEKEQKRKQREWKSIETIGIGAPCPRCKQKLTKEHYETVKGDYAKELEELSGQIEKLSDETLQLDEQIKSLEEKQSALEKEKESETQIASSIATLQEKERSFARIKRSLSSVTSALERNAKKLKEEQYALAERKQLSEASERLKKLEPEMERFEQLKMQLKKHEEQEIERLYTKNEQIASRKKGIDEQLKRFEKRFGELEKNIALSEKTYTAKTNRFNRQKGILEKVAKLEETEKSVEPDWTSKNNAVAGKKAEIQAQRDKLDLMEKEIQEKEQLLLKQDIFRQYMTWLDEYFVPALESIERHVMASINEEFNELFKRWFSQLIETGEITVRVDENFTPLVEQSGYELDVASLSGGERTSVALAYRLALNVLVKKTCEAMHSNILILDEPTDGFSTEQLFRVRDILTELKCEQVIMVSHERELEGFVDKIYKIRKEAGISTVTEA